MSTHHISVLTLTFPFSLQNWQLPAFRSALIELTERKEELFHNHNNDKQAASPFLWEYPLIQYKIVRGRAAVMGLAEGATALTTILLPELMNNPVITFGGQDFSTVGWRIQNTTFELKMEKEPLPFGVHRWIGLNADNYHTWKTLEDNEGARQALLGRALTGHLRVLARRFVPQLESDAIIAEVLRVDQVKKVKWQKANLVAFTLVGESRLTIPLQLGLGRLIAYGFGTVMSPKNYQRSLGQRAKNNQQSKVL